MIDLHVHLDGSLPVQTVLRLAQEQHIALPALTEEALLPYLKAPAGCRSLTAYLERFSLPLSLLQTPAALETAVMDICTAMAAQGLLYIELRFAPQLHTEAGMTQTDAVKAAVRGVTCSPIPCQLILCCMRGKRNRLANRETVRLAGQFLGHGVAGLDLAGAEALYPTAAYTELFGMARTLNIPFTIHAGEAAGADSIAAAVNMGASRIGHGVTLAEDPLLLQTVIDRGITLEMCPSSNVQTHAVDSLREHPLLDYLRKGVRVVVCTDNLTVSGTTLAKEFSLLRRRGMTAKEHVALLCNAADAAFLPSPVRERLKARIKTVKM